MLEDFNRSEYFFTRWCNDWISFTNPTGITFVHWETRAIKRFSAGNGFIVSISPDGRYLQMEDTIIDACEPATSGILPHNLGLGSGFGDWHEGYSHFVGLDLSDNGRAEALFRSNIQITERLYRTDHRLYQIGMADAYVVLLEEISSAVPTAPSTNRVLRVSVLTGEVVPLLTGRMIEVDLRDGFIVAQTMTAGDNRVYWQPITADEMHLVWSMGAGINDADYFDLRYFPDGQMLWGVEIGRLYRLDLATGDVTLVSDDASYVNDYNFGPYVGIVLPITGFSTTAVSNLLTSDGRVVPPPPTGANFTLSSGRNWRFSMQYGDSRLFFEHGNTPAQPIGFTFNHYFSPDGREVVYTRVGSTGGIEIIDLTSGSFQPRIVPLAGPRADWGGVFVEDWLSSGIYFSSLNYSSSVEAGMYAVQPDGGGLRLVPGALQRWQGETFIDDPSVSFGHFADGGVSAIVAWGGALLGVLMVLFGVRWRDVSLAWSKASTD